MDIATYDNIPRSSNIAAYIDNIAVFDNLDKIQNMKLPAKIDFFLSILCEEGSLLISYDDIQTRVNANHLLVMKPGHIIQRYETSHDFKGHCIVVSTSLLDETTTTLSRILPFLAKAKDNPVIALSRQDVENQVELRNLLKKKAYSEGHTYQKDVIRAILEAIFYETLGLYNDYFMPKERSVTMRRRDALLYNFIEQVEKHFRQERSVAFYADLLCVTPKYLSATVKETSGRTAGEWIDSYVILEAKILLRNTGLTIQEVSNKLNFNNQSFFGKYFKHLTGVSPRNFRNNPN